MRQKIARAFEAWGGFVASHPWPVLLVTLATCVTFAAQIPHVTFDMSTEGFLHADDPTLQADNEFRARVDRDDSIVVGVETEDLFDQSFLEQFRRFHAELEADVPFVDEITSLTNARWTRGDEDQRIGEGLM